MSGARDGSAIVTISVELRAKWWATSFRKLGEPRVIQPVLLCLQAFSMATSSDCDGTMVTQRESSAPSSEFEEAIASVRSLTLVDTPRSRQNRGVRVPRGELEGRVLFDGEACTLKDVKELPAWTDGELGALVSFLMLHTNGKSWVAHKDSRFWDEAGLFIQQSVKTTHRRSGMFLFFMINDCMYIQQ